MADGLSNWAIFRIFVYIGGQLKKTLFRRPLGYFLSPEKFYGQFLGKKAKKISITHETQCLDRDDELADALQAFDAGKITVLHITAPPGHGKSRFALELSRRLRGKGRGAWWFLWRKITGRCWRVYFVREYAKSVSDHVTELRSSRKLAIFVDNAHEAKETVRELASYAKMAEDEGKILLICLSRSTLKNVIVDALSFMPPEEVNSAVLQKLSKSTIAKIVKAELPDESESLRKRIVGFAGDSVFLSIHICQLVKRKVDFSESITDDLFRRKICDAPIEEAVRPCAISTVRAIRAATVLSAAAPVDCNDQAIRQITCELADISDVELQCLLDQLVVGSIFSKYAKSMIRPVPDLIGALLIDNSCIAAGKPNRFAEDLLKALLPKYSRQALDNLSDLGWTQGTSEAIDLVGPVIADAAKAIDLKNPLDCRDQLEVFGPLSLRRSHQVVGFIQKAWAKTTQAIDTNEDNAKEWKRVMGEAVPMLGAATNKDDTAESAMAILKEMVTREGVDTNYSNHEPQTVLTESIGFSTNRSVEQTSNRMSIVERWFKSGGQDAVTALRSLEGVLSTTVQWTESEAFTVSFKKTSLNLSKRVRGVRDRAVSLISKGLGSDEAVVQDAAFFAASQIGSYRGGGASRDAAELVELEKSRVIEAIQLLVDQDQSRRACMQSEHCLWDWWRVGSDDLAEKCESVLRTINDDAAYRIFKHIYSSQLPLSKITHILDVDPSSDRSRRFFDNRREAHEMKREPLIVNLSAIGLDDNADEWIEFFLSISDANCKTEWRASQVFLCLGELFPNTAWTLIESSDDALWSDFKASMLSGVRLADISRWDVNVSKQLRKPNWPAETALAWQSSLDFRTELRELDWKLVQKCNDTGDSWVLDVMSQNLSHGSASDWRRRCEFLLGMAHSNPKHLKVIDHCFATFTHNRPASYSGSLIDLDYDALDFLISPDVHEDVPWTSPYWVGTFLELIAKLDEDKYLDFIEKSFQSEDRVRRMHLRILGATNAKKAFDRLLESGLKRSHIFRFFDWAAIDNMLGEFAGSVISKQLRISDPTVTVQLERLYSAGAYEDLARILRYFEVGNDWLFEVDRLLMAVDCSCPTVFERIEAILSASYWSGMTSRKPGYPAPRDKAVLDFANNRLSDDSLSPRVRRFYLDRRDAATASIENDLAGDERLFGGEL